MSLLTSLPETVSVSDSTVLNCLGSIDSCSTTIDPKAPTSPSSILQCSVNESTSIPSYKNSSALVSASVDEQSSSSSVDDSDSLDGQDSDSHVSLFYQLSLTIVLTTIQKHDTDASSDQGDSAERADLCCIADAQNHLLALEVMAFCRLRQDMRRVGQSHRLLAKARSDVDKIYNNVRAFRAYARLSGRESWYTDIIRDRQRAFLATLLYKTISPLVEDYDVALKQIMADANLKPSESMTSCEQLTDQS